MRTKQSIRMETRKIKDVVEGIVKNLKKQDEYHEHIRDFFRKDNRLAGTALEIDKKENSLFLYAQNPQQFYCMQTTKNELLQYLQQCPETADIQRVIIRMKTYGR